VPAAVITGAYGYLGSHIRQRLETAGWTTTAFVRSPRAGDLATRWSLEHMGSLQELEAVDALVHCAYDFRPRAREEIWRVNVGGTSRLLAEAEARGVSRILVLSSMSAYPGTRQLYGQAKLAIEDETVHRGGIAVRPGLVYGTGSTGGMAGALLRLARLPVVPIIGGTARQFPIHEDDLSDAILRILEDEGWLPEVMGIAQPQPVTFRQLLTLLASIQDLKPRYVPVPWRAVYGMLRTLEAARIPTSFRSDSILGLVRPAPDVRRSVAFPDLLDNLRRIGGTTP
jgi:nucleoside-diphosphate-sugar epimerase